MKISQLFFAAIAMTVLAACDNVSPDERFIDVPIPEAQRTILIEDFTGQRCVNCPTASAEIDKIMQQYDAGRVIAVSIHAGPFSRSMLGKRYALATDEGDAYFAATGADHQPIGMVNRQGLVDYPSWNARVYEQIQLTTPVTIALGATLDEEAGTLAVSTMMLSGADVAGAKLQLWLVEDGVVAFQLQPDGSTDSEYVHHHVLRAALNGTWGEDVTLKTGVPLTLEHTVALADYDNVTDPRGLVVVAFVYTADGVLQATEAIPTPPQTE